MQVYFDPILGKLRAKDSGGGGGTSPADVTRITNLENNEYKILYFASISAATGTVTKPTGSTILLDQFYSGGDAVVETLVNGQPSGQSPLTAGGAVVSVSSFDTAGNFTLSGTPSSFNVALVYIIKIPALYIPNLTTDNIMAQEDYNTNIVIGTSTITSGTNTRILYNNNGIVGEYTITGTGTVVAMQTSPSFLTSTSITAITATTSSNDILETLTNNSSGTPAASYGLSRLIQLKTTTTDSQTAGKEIFSWSTATHASRQSQYAIQLVGNASVGNLQDAFKIVANGNSFKFQFVNHIGYDPRVEFLTGTAMRAYIENSGDNLTFNTVNSSSAYFSWRAGLLTNAMRLSTTGLFIGGDIAATAALQVRKTTEQFRVEYDASNYYSTTVGSTGGVTFNAVGAGAKFTFSDNIELTQTVTTEVVVSDTTVTIVINGTTYKLLARA